MMEPPRISVITPTYNRLPLLRETIASVQAQHFADWEMIVVDDGSSDGTAQAMAEVVRADPRIRFIEREGTAKGGNVCRNIGLRAARAELIVLLDSDDLLRPHCLGGRVAAMDRNRDLDLAVFGSSAFRQVPGDLPHEVIADPYGDAMLRFLCFDAPWIITGPVWRKSMLERLDGFNEALPSWQDVDLHIRALTSGGRHLRFAEIDHDIRWQFEHEKVSILQRRSLDHLRAAISMFAGFETCVRQGPGMDWSRQRAICGLYFFVSELMVQAGSLRDAMQCWKVARMRGLSPAGLYFFGLVLILLAKSGLLGETMTSRIFHKWRGMVRFRINPELLEAKGASQGHGDQAMVTGL